MQWGNGSPTFGAIIRDLRRNQRLSQADVEFRAKSTIKKGWLNQLERGAIKHPAPEKLARLANILGSSLSEIYGEMGIEMPYPG